MKFTGKHPSIEWVKTDLYSLDIALRRNYNCIGWPTRTLIEVYGPTSIGKSHFINSMSAILAKKLELNIACLDLEPQDEYTVESICNALGFDGEWKWVEPSEKAQKKSAFSDEHLLGELRDNVENEFITILDSVASIAPVAEVEGDIGDANMGRRAFPMAQYARLMNRELKWSNKGTVSFMANHKYEKMATGLPMKTYTAPGGQVKENMAYIRIEAKTPYIPMGANKKLSHFGEGWIFEGKILKNRFGISSTDFWVFIIGGQGIHRGLTALFDCIKLDLAKTGGAAPNTMTIQLKNTGEEFGKVVDIIKERATFDFSPFYDALKSHQLSAQDDAEAMAKAKEEEIQYESIEEGDEDE